MIQTFYFSVQQSNPEIVKRQMRENTHLTGKGVNVPNMHRTCTE